MATVCYNLLIACHSQVLEGCIKLGVELVQGGCVAQKLYRVVAYDRLYFDRVPLGDEQPDVAYDILRKEFVQLILYLALKVLELAHSEDLVHEIPNAAAKQGMQRPLTFLGPHPHSDPLIDALKWISDPADVPVSRPGR